MKLNEEQESILNGERSKIETELLQLMIKWGDAVGAERFVPVTNVQPVLSAPGNVMKGATDKEIKEYMENVIKFTSLKSKVKNTTHISWFDVDNWKYFNVAKEQADFNRRLIDIGFDSGITFTWTCTPYIVGNVPMPGERCAWMESHAVVFINSMLGARTTRHGTESAVAAATFGFTPEFGVMLDENRRGDFLVEVKEKPVTPIDWGALGYFTGKKAGLRIPVFSGVEAPNIEQAKQLSASLASSGGVSMFHIEGITPEARTLKDAFQGDTSSERYTYGIKDKAQMFDILRDVNEAYPEIIFLGCPHCTLEEIRQIAVMLHNRTIYPNICFEIYTAYAIKANAERLGYIKIIEDAGAIVLTDSCPCTAVKGKGKKMLTNSFKQAHYARGLLNCEVIVDTMEKCVDTAITGRWSK